MDDEIERSRAGRCVLRPELAELSDDEVTSGFDSLLAAARNAAWHRLAYEAEIERRQMWKSDGLASLRTWIGMRTGEGDKAAHHEADLAIHLAEYPFLSDGLAMARFSMEHVRLLLTLARLTDLDDRSLADLGESHTVSELESACRAARRLSRQVDSEGHRRRGLQWWHDQDGTVHLRGRLHGIEGISVITALSAMAEAYDPDPLTGEFDPFASRCADALVELCNGWNDTGADAAEGPAAEGPAAEGPAAEGPAAEGPAAEGPGEGVETPSASTLHYRRRPSGRDRASVVLHVPIAALDPDDAVATAMTWEGGLVSTDTIRRLLCDTRLRLTLDDADGHPVGIGRRSRIIPAWLLAELRWRDRHCRFAACEHTRWLHAHHLEHWADGGATDLDNLVLLCPRHHRSLHEGEWRVSGNPARRLIWEGPTGRRYCSSAAPQPHTWRKRPSLRRGVKVQDDP